MNEQIITLTEAERGYVFAHFNDMEEWIGDCILVPDVEGILAARVAAARADERARVLGEVERRIDREATSIGDTLRIVRDLREQGGGR